MRQYQYKKTNVILYIHIRIYLKGWLYTLCFATSHNFTVLLQRITKRTDIPAEDSDGAKESSETEEAVKISR